MSNDPDSSDDDKEAARAFLDTIDAVGKENLIDILADSLINLQSRDLESMDMTVRGPSDESKYYLNETKLGDQYHSISRDTTRLVLEASPRQPSEIRVFATRPLLSDQEAAHQLCEHPGITCGEDTIQGRTAISPEVLDNVFSIYEAGLHHIHFFDSDGKGIAARYDDRLQHYGLPNSVYRNLKSELPEEVYNAID